MSQQRKIYSALQTAGQPLTQGQMARMAKLDVHQISCAVSKLRSYGYIEIASQTGKGSHTIRTYRPTLKLFNPQPMGRP